MKKASTFNTSDPVLLVEDDAIISIEVVQILSDLGFEDIDVCLNYEDAQTQLPSRVYGLVVFDIKIGNHLSFGLITEAVKLGYPIISMSGYLPEAQKIENTTFLPKPLDIARFPDAIAQAQCNAATKH